MWWFVSLLCPAWATTFPPAPPLAEQLERAEAAGVYVVRATRTVTLPDGFVATRADVEALGEPVRGEVRKGLLGVPGGLVGDRYVDGMEGAPRVAPGDVLFLFLQPHDDRYILRDGFTAGLYRRVETSSGAVMVDGGGHPVTAVTCDARPVRGEGDPLPWDAAVAAFATCGGAR